MNIPDTGGELALNVLFGATAKTTSFTLQLFCGAIPPTLADSDANDTFEAPTGSVGEAAKTLANNATVDVDESGIPIATWAEQTWTFSGGLTNTNKIVQGWQLLSGTTVLAEDLFASPVTPAAGVVINFTPAYRLGNGTPA